MTANGLYSLVGTQSHLTKTMQDWLPGAIKELHLNDWDVVWGPTVWKQFPEIGITGPDNTWYVARNPTVQFPDGSTHEMYVVANAGTAQYSTQDWLLENTGIVFCVDFHEWAENIREQPPISWLPDDNSRVYVARGAAQAVQTVINTPAPAGSFGAGTTLLDFLRTVSPASKVVYAGHSLGGALTA
jgi:hypothetical protein